MGKIFINAKEAVKEAGKLFTGRTEDLEISQKMGESNFVTSVDLAVQDLLVERLSNIIPGSNIITEESDENLFKFDKPTWILDPVDGTTNLMYDFRMSAVSLALIIDGKLNSGIIYNPFSNEMFTANAGEGAFLNEKPISIRKTQNFSECLMGFGTTPYDRSNAERTFEITKSIFINCREVRRSGSAALDIAYVACGRLDGFYELNLQPWDYAAGAIILNEAGGRITNWNSKPVSLLKPDSIAASNGLVHEELMGYLKS